MGEVRPDDIGDPEAWQDDPALVWGWFSGVARWCMRSTNYGMSHTREIVDPHSDRVPPPECGCGGLVRPGVVWFGEMLPQNAFAEATARAQACDVFVLVGTSGVVYLAAGLPHIARGAGAVIIEINLQETNLSDACDITIRSTAAVAIPALVDAVASTDGT